MNTYKALFIASLLSLLSWSVAWAETPQKTPNPRVVMETTMGDITLELFPEQAPLSVANFLSYSKEGHYNGTLFHRVIDGFMIQGGGFDEAWQQRQTKASVKNEANNGLKNLQGTLAMARTAEVDSATSQFFINLVDNTSLDHGANGFGYAVFGRVVEGMKVVTAIAQTPTTSRYPFQNVPTPAIVIKKVRIIEP